MYEKSALKRKRLDQRDGSLCKNEIFALNYAPNRIICIQMRIDRVRCVYLYWQKRVFTHSDAPGATVGVVAQPTGAFFLSQ